MSSRPLDARLLHTFLTVAREGNVSRAAEKLFLSQPAVSLQLKELAGLTQLELFTRGAAGVTLTRDGAALLAHAQRALESLGDFTVAAQRLASRARGTLRIGTILDPEFTRLGVFLHELGNQAPDIQPELQHGMSGTVLGKVLRGELDVGYYVGDAQADAALVQSKGRGSPPAIHSEVLTRFTYRVVAPRGWEQRVLGGGWEALVRLPWIRTPSDSVHARLLTAALEPLRLQQNGVAMVDQEPSMLALVRAGVGLALARDSIAMSVSQAEGLVVADRVCLETELCFIARASARSAPMVAAASAALDRTWALRMASDSAVLRSRS